VAEVVRWEEATLDDLKVSNPPPTSRPIPGFRDTRRADRGYGTARADTKLSITFCLFVSLIFSLCFRYSSQSTANIQTELPAF